MTKRLFRATNGAIGKTDYGNAARFDVQKHTIGDLADLVGVLYPLAFRSDSCVIRGLPLAHHNVRRRIHGSEAAFKADPTGHHWMMCDFDEAQLPLFLNADDDPELLLRFLVGFLPPGFHAASFYWQWSCGQGLDGGKTLRAHLWFWSRDKHSDAEYENWARWVNGTAGWKILDPVVFRTVQPNYVAAPIIGDGAIDPVRGERQGVYVGDTNEVALSMPAKKWEDHVRQLERDEYQELVEYGLRQPYSRLDQTDSAEKFVEYLDRIGDDRDGFYDLMTKAIWHFARTHPPEQDEDFKALLRQVVRSARCTKLRDLDAYLADYRLDASLRGAREKQRTSAFQPKPPPSKLAAFQQAMRRHSFTRSALQQ
jgi:hypothetical protein